MKDSEAIQMLERCKQEISSLRIQIERLTPRAEAYDNIAVILSLLPRSSGVYGEDLIWTIDKRLRELSENLANEVVKKGELP